MIVINKEHRVFTLHTKNTTYQMKADRHNVLIHTYYGPRVGDCDLSYLVRYADRACAPTPWTPSPRSTPPAAWGISACPPLRSNILTAAVWPICA